MILNNHEILYNLEHNKIRICRVDESDEEFKIDSSCVIEESITFTLDKTLRFFKTAVIDSSTYVDISKMGKIDIPPEGFVVTPGALFVGLTREYLECDKFLPVASETPAMAFCGVSTVASAASMHKGWHGRVPLVIHVAQPVRLFPGMDICRVRFHTVCGANEE